MIDSLDVLNAYFDMIWKIRQEDLLRDIKNGIEGRHPTSDIINVCVVMAKTKGTNVWQEYQYLKETQHQQMSDMVIEGHTLYVNPNGGYTVDLKNITNRYESEKLLWPVFTEEDIRVKQWPGGTHYYAYIGPIQVKDGETVKWASESDARNIAMSYVTRKRRMK